METSQIGFAPGFLMLYQVFVKSNKKKGSVIYYWALTQRFCLRGATRVCLRGASENTAPHHKCLELLVLDLGANDVSHGAPLVVCLPGKPGGFPAFVSADGLLHRVYLAFQLRERVLSRGI